jgi:CheY-like chemotaxis protein
MRYLDRNNIRLLIVEDNTLHLFIVSRMLEKLGYAFDAVENGFE